MAVSPRGPSYIKQVETRSTTRRVFEIKKGEVFLREGTAHMRVEPSGVIEEDNKVWVVNLVTGSCWLISAREEVYPCMDIELTFKSARC